MTLSKVDNGQVLFTHRRTFFKKLLVLHKELEW